MKAKPIFSLLLAVALCGGLLLAFPTLWMALVLALVALLAVQLGLLRRNVTVVHSNATPSSFRVSLGRSGQRAGGSAASGVRAALNQELFSRFRAHLESAENQTAPTREAPAEKPAERKPALPAAQRPPPAEEIGPDALGAVPALGSLVEDAQSGDRVALSAASRQSAARPIPPVYRNPAPGVITSARPAPRAVPETTAPEAEEVDWFADMRPALAATTSAAPPAPPQAAPKATPLKPPSGKLSIRKLFGAGPAETMRPAPKQAAPAASDEAGALLKLGQEALRRGDLRGARAGLEQYLSEMASAEGDIAWQARWLEARLSVLDGQATPALSAFEAMLKAGFEPKEDALPGVLDELLAGAPADLGDSLRVAMLLKMLAEFRQANQRPAMDRLYVQLAEAQLRVGDERKLIQVLKNHLEIKKVMGDVPGQLDLIDQIGNRLFKVGDTAQAREFYAQGLKLRADQQTAAAAASPTDTTASTASAEAAAPRPVPAAGVKVGGGGTG